jgi:hypothetical protein
MNLNNFIFSFYWKQLENILIKVLNIRAVRVRVSTLFGGRLGRIISGQESGLSLSCHAQSRNSRDIIQ